VEIDNQEQAANRYLKIYSKYVYNTLFPMSLIFILTVNNHFNIGGKDSDFSENKMYRDIFFKRMD
jgi:hypothetical protein